MFLQDNAETHLAHPQHQLANTPHLFAFRHEDQMDEAHIPAPLNNCISSLWIPSNVG